MTITEFLASRLDEDEAAAREVIDAPPAYGFARGHDAYDEAVNIASNEGGLVEVLNHTWRWSPERVLAEVAAKRAIIDAAWADSELIEVEYLLRGRDELEADGDVPTTIRLLAQPYAEHPDFDPAWRV